MPQTRTAATATLPEPCFHCLQPIPLGCDLCVAVDGMEQPVCCHGCQAIVMSITDRGLEDYYRLRSEESAGKPQGQRVSGELQLYDDAAVQARFVREVAASEQAGDGHAGPSRAPWLEAELLVEDMRCAACAWLVERTLAREPGVRQVEVVFATRRARLVWDPAAARLSTLLAAARAVGYRACPYEPARLEQLEKRERREALWRLFVAGFGMMQVMMYALPVYLADAGSMSADIEQLMRWAGLILTLPVMLYSAAPFFAGAWRDLRVSSLGMDVPVAIGVAVAFAASVWSTVAVPGPVYYDSVAMFVFLLLGGRYLELLARQQAGRSLQFLARLIPEAAHRLENTLSGQTSTVPALLLRPGDRVLVLPGETLPADGVLETAQAQVSEALLTGESRQLPKTAGAALTGGALNTGSAFSMRVTRVGADTALSCIARLAGRALGERPRWVQAAQRAAGVFIAVILLCAAVAGMAWMWIDPARALWVAVSVLIVTCPCALSLATPVAMSVAVGHLARSGVVVSRGRAIEALAGCTDVVFDKTGTLTEGRLTLLETMSLGRRGVDACLAMAAAVEQGSEHPVAAALRAAAAQDQLPQARDHVSTPGAGIEAWVEGRRVRMGKPAYVSQLHGQPAPLAWLRSNDTVAWLGDEDGWIAAFRLGDAVRSESRQAVATLEAMGLRVHLLSGDADAVARRVGAELALQAVRVVSGATPEGKLAYVRGLQAGGARVAMVGDGVNDAPVLAQADVSVALRGGADLAQITADAVLLSDSPLAFAHAIALARLTRRVIRQNLAWALGYNLVVLPLAFAGMVTPIAAGIGMSASSLLVVLNALRLTGGRR